MKTETLFAGLTPEQIALHRHWCRADAIKYVLFEARPSKKKVRKELYEVGMFHSQLLRLEAFYALFYVVIEGYKELGFKYEKIDALLKEEAYVERLRRFRNAVFHYQKNPLNLKLVDFLEAKDSATWIKTLYRAFNEFFEDTLHIKETLARMGWNNT
jgi:hypothetical protein